MDDMSEQQQFGNEVQEAISQPVGLMNEFDEVI